ncbi:hypothetical protein NEHOM01_0717 [Nematocida homosporus]|uniref:uncharacterized protein n=1 Tax=Nematocida homosporus TaxID=1912981 RepID=UPI0022205192|nr:uncharacterized protein NEHOM01_0717 [Nematocida homosporus]KAI5185259.1 hypothetical protein NEHOM01_0717 [Nematocida homosporus]
MEGRDSTNGVPLNMRWMTISSCFLLLPSVVAEQMLKPKLEIIVSLIGMAVGPYFALIPGSYRNKYVFGSLLGIVPVMLMYAPYARAFSLGTITSYYRLVADLYGGALCVKTKKKDLSLISSLVSAWISVGTFFSLHFCPTLSAAVGSCPAMLTFAIFGAILSHIYIIETPEEILERIANDRNKSQAYEDMYAALAHINGPGKKSQDDLQKEYKEILEEKKNEKEKPVPVKERARAIGLSINISFIYMAFQKAMGVDGKYTLYRVFLGVMQLFSWSLKYTEGAHSFFSTALPVLALYFVCISTNSHQDIILVVLMLLGIEYAPGQVTGYKLRPLDIAISRSIQCLCALLTFLVVTQYIIY